MIKKTILWTLILTLALTAFTGCQKNEAAPTEETISPIAVIEEEAVEEEDVVEEEPSPIVVAGTVSATRILHGLGVTLTAVPQTEKALPEDIAGLPSVGLPMNPDLELVKSHNPDFFITDATLEERLADSLKEQGIETLFLKTSGYSDIIDAISTLGEHFNKQTNAEAMIAHINALEKDALALAKGKEAPTVAIIFGTPESFMLATDFSYVGDLAKKLGAVNITSGMDNVRGPYVPFSLETLAEMNPDMILRMTHVNPEQSKIMFDNAFDGNAFYSALKAVKDDKVIDLDSNYFGVVATVDCGEAILMMAEHLYGK